MTQNDLKTLGWNPFFQNQVDSMDMDGFEVGRIAIENRNTYLVYSAYGDLRAEVTGKMLFSSFSAAELPKVGDWVVFTLFKDEKKAIIHRILERKTKFSRNVAGKKTDEQVVAVNIDLVFTVQGLDDNFNLRRLERYLVMAYESKAEPAIILSKTDLCEHPEEKVAAVRTVAEHVPVYTVSSLTGEGIDSLKSCVREGMTMAFIGSSGVGKSTIINKMIGKEILKTAEVRMGDSKGRHTTNRRELILLPQGGLLVDTPGMRELQVWNADDGLQDTFANIEEMGRTCFFADCRHTVEKKCAVIQAVEDGILSVKRYENYLKLQKEMAFLETKQKKTAFLEQKKRNKQFGREIKRMKKTLKKR